ncbi:MAG TPA: hypothetical protein VGL77_06275 [Armatimonadota bacterium]|jgi:hypothetical protein
MSRLTSGVLSFLTLLTLACLLLGARASAADAGKTTPAIVAKCQQDLAKRLKLPAQDIEIVDVQERLWTDSSLGITERGKAYAKIMTPGWRIVLGAKSTQYLYTASDRAFQFGGPKSLWNSSMLYLLPATGEPNLNFDLYQCSLIGTNHILLISGIASYSPQAKGVVLVTRRTSRSGYDLLALRPGEGEKAQRLYAALFIGEAALNTTQDRWAAVARPALGSGWNVATARVGEEIPVIMPTPDDLQPASIAWSGEKVMILVNKNQRMVCYETTPTAAAPAWQAVDITRYPGALDDVLSKSTSLVIEQTGAHEKPVVDVTTVWFTGDRNPVATIAGLTLGGHAVLDYGYAFIWGTQQGKPAVYTVRLSTGEVTPGFCGTCQEIKPFPYAPISAP